jgi:hypothetical protein
MPRKKPNNIWVDGVGYVPATRAQWNSLTDKQRQMFTDLRKETKRRKKEALAEEKESRRAKRLARGRRWHFSPKTGPHGKWLDGEGIEPPRDPLRVNPNQTSFDEHIDRTKNPYWLRMEEPKRQAPNNPRKYNNSAYAIHDGDYDYN